MTIFLTLAVLVALIGLALFLVAPGKASAIGLAMFSAGLTAALIRGGGLHIG